MGIGYDCYTKPQNEITLVDKFYSWILEIVLTFTNMLPCIAEVRGSNDKLARAFGLVDKYPQLVAVCAGASLLGSEVFQGDMKSIAQIDAFLKKFEQPKTCAGLTAKADKLERERKAQVRTAGSLTRQQLNKKRVGELRTIVEDLGISTAALAEKSDYVEAILRHGQRGEL